VAKKLGYYQEEQYLTKNFDDKLIMKLIQNVTVYDDHFVIYFKSGIEIEV